MTMWELKENDICSYKALFDLIRLPVKLTLKMISKLNVSNLNIVYF